MLISSNLDMYNISCEGTYTMYHERMSTQIELNRSVFRFKFNMLGTERNGTLEREHQKYIWRGGG